MDTRRGLSSPVIYKTVSDIQINENSRKFNVNIQRGSNVVDVSIYLVNCRVTWPSFMVSISDEPLVPNQCNNSGITMVRIDLFGG